MVRSAPPQNVSLAEVMTAPLTAASADTLSASASSSWMVAMSMTFIDLPGMSQVISAMPSASSSYLKLLMSRSSQELLPRALARQNDSKFTRQQRLSRTVASSQPNRGSNCHDY